jgi:GxxExxY protein
MEKIIDIIKEESIRVNARLGPFYTENCYKLLLVEYLKLRDIDCIVEKPIDIYIDKLLLTTKRIDIYVPEINLIIELKCYAQTLISNKSGAIQQLQYYMQEYLESKAGLIIVFRTERDKMPLKSNIYQIIEPAFYFFKKTDDYNI